MQLGFKIYEHAAALLNRTPWEVSRDPDLLLRAHRVAYELYRHEPIIPAVDHYNLVPEAYGGVVVQPDGNGVPAISHPKVNSAADLLRLEPFDPQRAGRIPLVMEVAARLAREFPQAKVRVPVSGPFSIASALVGFDTLLCEVAESPEVVQAALLHLVEGEVRFTAAVKAMGLDVAFAESAAGPPLLSPALFRRVELPALKELLARMGSVLGHPVACLMGGDTVKILDALLETDTPALVCPHETDQVAFLQKVWQRTDICVRVNMHAGIVARGTWLEVKAEADRILGVARRRPNTVLGAGVLPYETKTENVLRLREYVAAF